MIVGTTSFPFKEAHNTMRKKSSCRVGPGGGLAGFGLRRWQWLSAYDAQTSTLSPRGPATFALLALTALLVLAFLVLCRGKRRPEGFLDAFFCPSPGFMGLMAASGFCF